MTFFYKQLHGYCDLEMDCKPPCLRVNGGEMPGTSLTRLRSGPVALGFKQVRFFIQNVNGGEKYHTGNQQNDPVFINGKILFNC